MSRSLASGLPNGMSMIWPEVPLSPDMRTCFAIHCLTVSHSMSP